MYSSSANRITSLRKSLPQHARHIPPFSCFLTFPFVQNLLATTSSFCADGQGLKKEPSLLYTVCCWVQTLIEFKQHVLQIMNLGWLNYMKLNNRLHCLGLNCNNLLSKGHTGTTNYGAMCVECKHCVFLLKWTREYSKGEPLLLVYRLMAANTDWVLQSAAVEKRVLHKASVTWAYCIAT